MQEVDPTTVYTIGHSNHSRENFLVLLRQHSIGTLADVRSRPVSRFPQFRQEALRHSLEQTDIKYVYLGQELGGHPSPEEFYDSRGHVIYERIAGRNEFRRGIRQIVDLASTTRLVIMCAEGNPAQRHRHPLIARVLLERGLIVHHIGPDGTLQDAATMFAHDEANPNKPFCLAPVGL